MSCVGEFVYYLLIASSNELLTICELFFNAANRINILFLSTAEYIQHSI